MCTTFNGNPYITIFSPNSSTNASDKTDIFIFYNGLSYFARHIPKHNVLIIHGDMNADKGKDENNEFWLDNLQNSIFDLFLCNVIYKK